MDSTALAASDILGHLMTICGLLVLFVATLTGIFSEDIGIILLCVLAMDVFPAAVVYKDGAGNRAFSGAVCTDTHTL